MTNQEFLNLKKIHPPRRVITVSDLVNKSPRSLLVGRIDSCKFHFYFDNGYFCQYIFSSLFRTVDSIKKSLTIDVEELVFDVLYSHKCDFEFCCLLKKMDVPLPMLEMPETSGNLPFFSKYFLAEVY